MEAARVLYAAVAAHRLAGQPVWPMAVAPPGSMKTELIRALDGQHGVHSIDSVTPKTFISGQIRDKGDTRPLQASSLLHRIGNSAVLLCADFSTILAIKSDDRNAILADLRRIYDGELRKEYGTSEAVPVWRGRLTLIAGVTPEIDSYQTVIQSLGDRFVMVRWGRAGLEAAIQAMTQDLGRVRADVQSAVHGLFASLPEIEPTVAGPMLPRLAALGELAARGRSAVRREKTYAVIDEPQPESAPRLAQQLCQLAKGSALLSHRAEVTEEDFELARRAAFDCLPPRRRAAFDTVVRRGRVAVETSSQQYGREDLQVLGLMQDAHLSELGEKLLDLIDPNRTLRESPPSSVSGNGNKEGGPSPEWEVVRGRR